MYSKQQRLPNLLTTVRFISLVILLALFVGASSRASERTVVVMLFDGFSPKYISQFSTPALDRMREGGAWSHTMDPAFPTISLIGGVTISTGCWPDRHGIVSNLFIDPKRGFYDHSSDTDWLIDGKVELRLLH